MRIYKTLKGAEHAKAQFEKQGISCNIKKTRSGKNWKIPEAPEKQTMNTNIQQVVNQKVLNTGDFHTFGYPDDFWN